MHSPRLARKSVQGFPLTTVHPLEWEPSLLSYRVIGMLVCNLQHLHVPLPKQMWLPHQMMEAEGIFAQITRDCASRTPHPSKCWRWGLTLVDLGQNFSGRNF